MSSKTVSSVSRSARASASWWLNASLNRSMTARVVTLLLVRWQRGGKRRAGRIARCAVAVAARVAESLRH